MKRFQYLTGDMLWVVPCLMLVTNDRAGRDHYLQMFYVLAGGGVKGGTVIGQTTPQERSQ